MAISVQNFNPMIAVKSGVDTSQAMITNERKARQYNALRQLYGDAVGPDDTLAQLDANNRANQKLPGELEAQALTNAGKRQENAFNDLMNPLKLQQTQGAIDKQSLDNDYNRQTMGSRVQQEAAKAAQGQQTVQLNKQKIDKGEAESEDSAAERQRNAALGIVAAAKERIAANEDPTTVWNSIAPQIAAMENVDPGQLSQLRDMFLRDPKGTIGMVEQHANATRPQSAYLRSQAAMVSAQAARERAAAATAKANPPLTEAGVTSVIEQGNNVNRTLDSLIGTPEKPGLVDRVTRNPIMRTFNQMVERSTGGGFDTNEVAYIKDLQTLTASLGLDALQRLKAQGVTLGQVTEAEHALLQQSVARLQSTRDPVVMRDELQRIRTHYQRYQAALLNDMRKKPGGAETLERVQGGAPAEGDQAARRKALLDKYR